MISVQTRSAFVEGKPVPALAEIPIQDPAIDFRQLLDIRHRGALVDLMHGLTKPGPFTDLAVAAIEEVTGRKPELSTTGGTSDARFIARYCPVIEFGLLGQTMHQVDERAAVSDIEKLTKIYRGILDRYFG